MEKLLFLLIFVSCTQKYASYDLIRKADFNRATYERPITALQVMASGKDELKECFNQWLFFSNAEKQKDNEVPSMVRLLCPRQDYLVNAQFTETWWTVLFFSQSCVNIETTCGDLRRQ